MTHQIGLREVVADDLPIFYRQQLDPEANDMAAFTSADPTNRAAFIARWEKILDNPAIIKRSILADDDIAGHILQFEQFGKPAVSYWLGKPHWGRGIATAALALFLNDIPLRPLYARAAHDNHASIRVLQKNNFVVVETDQGYSNARGREVKEVILKLQ
jgi:RimJ/RimL family protein N-acetyltransferase